jgi:hypothetical protein
MRYYVVDDVSGEVARMFDTLDAAVEWATEKGPGYRAAAPAESREVDR